MPARSRKSSRDKDARKTLQTALRISNDFEGAEEARRVMATLLY